MSPAKVRTQWNSIRLQFLVHRRLKTSSSTNIKNRKKKVAFESKLITLILVAIIKIKIYTEEYKKKVVICIYIYTCISDFRASTFFSPSAH